MPAIITHHIFGEDASALLPEGILTGQEDLLAFLIGNQGADPFWSRFSTSPMVTRRCRQFANHMHSQQVGRALMALRSCVSHVRDEDKSVARAFALGMASHYVLDRLCHPLIYALQSEIIAADPSLQVATKEIHAIIEAELDSWMLWEKRNMTVLDVPCTQALARTSRIDRICGAMLSQVAWEVFGISVGAAEYGLAVKNYQLVYRVIDPPASRLPQLLARIEKLSRPYSRLLAQAHPVVTSSDCTFANLEHHAWKDSATGEVSIASFPDLFHDALLAWPVFSKRLVEGDQERLEAMIGGINYLGTFE